MARRKTLTDDGVARLPVKRKRYTFPDPELPMHYIRVTPGGTKSFVVVTRDRDNRQRWITIGPYPAYTIDAARKRASEIIRAVREGKTEPDSFEAVAANFMTLHCEAKGLRSTSEYKRMLHRMEHEWTGREFKSIGRADVTKLLDKVEAKSGPRPATSMLAIFILDPKEDQLTIADGDKGLPTQPEGSGHAGHHRSR